MVKTAPVVESKDKPWNWGSQALHFFSCFFMTLLTGGWGAPVVVVWAITREYYQRKRQMEAVTKVEPSPWEILDPNPDFGEGFDYIKRDLLVSYAGTATGLLLAIGYHNWWL